ncbi:Golgin candidate [Trema orientale]|uniref:Golgin candidate n=1 Tax=Trema orientale TaxID=63057 RepID=A0A2P5BLY1_TREOI|nr:Golgin candidate [Trema orientale]
MANWISSKLKAAETILQQIDQQAAESLKKNEKPQIDELNFDTATKIGGGNLPLKDQFKKKPLENNDFHGSLRTDPSLKSLSVSINKNESSNSPKEVVGTPKSSSKPKPTLTDSDWTQLLSTPSQPTSSGGAPSRGNGHSGIRGLRKEGRRQGAVASVSAGSEVRRNQKSSSSSVVSKPVTRKGSVEGNKLNGKASDGDESSFSDSAGRSSNVKLQGDGGKFLEGRELDCKEVGMSPFVKPNDKGNEENAGTFNSRNLSLKSALPSENDIPQSEMVSSGAGKVDGISDVKVQMADGHHRLGSTVRGKREFNNVASRSSTSDDLKRSSSSMSDGSSDSRSDSGSSSDSEDEREREERRRRREKILAEKAAAKAVDAIKERENMVARLEGEKQSLEKILEEQTKQHAQEASKLQLNMMETMEAVELEKQKHNNTRMEVLARLAKLETANADLARSLATVQWNLEVEVNQVAELRQQIELKEVNHEELRRKISNTHQTGTSLKKLAASKGVELEREILEEEYSFVTDKIGKVQDKAKQLEANIDLTRKEMEEPTEVEVELKRRLDQMTEHLIQKQAQVEALSSEKATILFRIETVSKMLEENKSMTDFAGTSSRDLESGAWELSDSKLKPLIEDKIRSGRKHLYSLLQQFDAIFLAGAVFLRRNPTAKLWSLVYLICLHFWVIYILMSHSQPSNASVSGAVFSLENINKTSGV